MYAEMIRRTNKEQEEEKEHQRNHTSEEGTKREEEVMEGKVSRIRQRDRSRKIPMGKPVGKEQKMSQDDNKEKVVTPTSRITITNIQEPRARVEKVWKNPSEEDKEKSKKLWETDPAPDSDPTATNKRVRFGLIRTLEYSPLEGETKGKDWKMFPELFLTDKGAEIYDALNKHQEIGQESRNKLLNKTNKQHQMAQKLAAYTKRLKPQYAATLKLKCGSWSNNNTVATLHALHKLILDLSRRSASNRIAQH